MSRYNWLKDLRNSVAREKFFVFTAVQPSDLEMFERTYGPLPPDYREFVEEFGEASMFLDPLQAYHHVGVIAPPKLAWEQCPGTALEFGWEVCDRAYFVWEAGAYVGNGTVFDANPEYKRQLAGSFEQWLVQSCRRSQQYFSKRQWAELRQPVAPFTEAEMKVVEAIPLFQFKKLGVSPEGKLVVEVQNNSQIEMPWLSIRMEWPGGVGGGSLVTAGIKPGETKVIEKENLYANIVSSEEIELVRKPIPTPEDRAYYAEFIAFRVNKQERK